MNAWMPAAQQVWAAEKTVANRHCWNIRFQWAVAAVANLTCTPFP
jgi:hypothetical protein